ncbi:MULTISPECIES: CsbD family protein [Actinopolyspora]|uniref:CsbD-like n=1 Tax=Actinopolyspora saharensis TaxID=995062 RepID=A0A1H1FDV9_9ACTN|nr:MULTISPECIES: CsbD family protein [Actinopolyspora]NHD19247.1 CsbD family protein [Actinopolyspora sp. BKK2]NHE78371.1 CsbD family protein [Actinopolyspora sp. BKK1]SDQ99028.1 CsbD-like [Actinopolyspora saharensis]
MSTFDKVKQQAQQLAGKAKEATGRVTGSQETENAGKRDRLEGEAKERGQDLKDRAEGTVQDAKDKLRGQDKGDQGKGGENEQR